MSPSETVRVQAYLRTQFGIDHLRLKARKGPDDSVEVFLADEFVGVIYRDEDEGEVSYQFQMAILEEDLPSHP